MKSKTYTIPSPVDGLPLSVLLTEPDEGNIRAVFQIVHGMAEMKERYTDFMEYLSTLGYACIIHDHRGHGQSMRSKEDKGYFYGVSGLALAEDVRAVSQEVKKLYPGKKHILMGHSMGSLVVRCFVKKYDDMIDGLIVMGPPSKNPAVGMGQFMAKTIALFRGRHHRSHFLNNVVFGSYAMSVKNRRTTYDWLSVNRENVDFYIHHDLCGFCFTLDGFLGLFELLKETYDESGWKASNPSLPILFVSGAEDPCIGSEENFRYAIDFMHERSYWDISSIMYPGMRHEILNETDNRKVYQDISNWLETKIR
ncbi:MAG: alpha/beta fold hydrolase [Lachnospiraceae bacterium]|nr:alpha/beta fold hydrolase [Candidatus Equihabitans merdae]